jgi:hypothetical protein
MKYYENLAQNLIQHRNNEKQLIEHTELRLRSKKDSVDVQLKRAENGKENTLAFEKAGLANIELELKYATDAFNAIIDEIEIQGLSANLKQNEHQSISVVSDNTTAKKFYYDNDFSILVKEILDLDYIRINEFLELHFSKSFGETLTDKMNWFTMLRKHILWLKKSMSNSENIDTTPKIGIAEIWEKQKRIAVYNDLSNKKTETPPTPETSKLTLREIALLYYFKGKKITVGNQNTFAIKHQQRNEAGKLYSEHFCKIVDDEKEIYLRRYAKKYLENIKQFFTDDEKEKLQKIDTFIKKCK